MPESKEGFVRVVSVFARLVPCHSLFRVAVAVAQYSATARVHTRLSPLRPTNLLYRQV